MNRWKTWSVDDTVRHIFKMHLPLQIQVEKITDVVIKIVQGTILKQRQMIYPIKKP